MNVLRRGGVFIQAPFRGPLAPVYLEGATTTETVTVTASLRVVPYIDAAFTTESPTVSGNIAVGTNITGAFTTDAVAVAGSLTQKNTVTGAFTTDAVSVAASLYLVPKITGAFTTDAIAVTTITPVTYALSLDHESFTEYWNYGFNSYARIGANYFAADTTGLYQLGANTDNGAQIPAHALTDMLELGVSSMKRVPRAYLAFTSANDVQVSVYTSYDGLRRSEPFTLSVPTAEVLRQACVPLSRGLASRYWQFRIGNTSGAATAIQVFAPHPNRLTRRI